MAGSINGGCLYLQRADACPDQVVCTHFTQVQDTVGHDTDIDRIGRQYTADAHVRIVHHQVSFNRAEIQVVADSDHTAGRDNAAVIRADSRITVYQQGANKHIPLLGIIQCAGSGIHLAAHRIVIANRDQSRCGEGRITCHLQCPADKQVTGRHCQRQVTADSQCITAVANRQIACLQAGIACCVQRCQVNIGSRHIDGSRTQADAIGKIIAAVIQPDQAARLQIHCHGRRQCAAAGNGTGDGRQACLLLCAERAGHNQGISAGLQAAIERDVAQCQCAGCCQCHINFRQAIIEITRRDPQADIRVIAADDIACRRTLVLQCGDIKHIHLADKTVAGIGHGDITGGLDKRVTPHVGRTGNGDLAPFGANIALEVGAEREITFNMHIVQQNTETGHIGIATGANRIQHKRSG